MPDTPPAPQLWRLVYAVPALALFGASLALQSPLVSLAVGLPAWGLLTWLLWQAGARPIWVAMLVAAGFAAGAVVVFWCVLLVWAVVGGSG